MAISRKDMLQKVGISSFEQLDPSRFKTFANLAPQMDTHDLRDVVRQIPNFESIALEAFKACSTSNSKCIDMCDKVVTALTRIVSSGETLEARERIEYLRQMREFTEMAHKKDREQKGLTLATFFTVAGVVALGLFLGSGNGNHKK